MIVMVLMGMLSLLGVIFYTFAAQERSNASYYADAAKKTADPSLDCDALFDWALDQIIVGTDSRLKNSMLWGSRYSLLSNALGVGYNQPGDMHPFNGEGVNVIFDSSTGLLGVDQDRNGFIEASNAYLLDWVDSPSAQNQIERQLVGGTAYFPQPDVGYTYPDINSPFLCYVGKVRDQNGQIHKVVKPSYMLPAMLRNPTTGAPLTNWYNDSTTVARSMRAHPNHVYVFPSPTPITVSRYLTDAEATAKLGAGYYGFPNIPMKSTYNTTSSGGGPVYSNAGMGPFTKASPTPMATAPNGDDLIEFDYDNDGDLDPEAILMDLDYPPQLDASGKMFVPMFLVTIHDLDALINLNVHGNLSKILYSSADNGMATTSVSNSPSAPFGTDSISGNFFYISQSNLGLGPAEVNPAWGLNARSGVDNTGTAVFSQHQKFFGSNPQLLSGSNPAWGETANMELLWTKIGTPQFSTSGSIQNLLPGVYGEENLMYQAFSTGSYQNAGGLTLPRPGIAMQDDNGDMFEGQGFAPYFQHPLDYTGQGNYLSTAKQINWIMAGADRRIAYTKYNSNVYSSNPTNSTIRWGQHTNGGGQSDLMLLNLTQGNFDDPYEIAYYNTDNRTSDNLFAPEEMLFLRLNNSEVGRLNVNSRLAALLPFNFAKSTADNARGESIRRKFTTLSNDRKNFSLPYSTSGRSWEYSMDVAAVGGNQGPYIRTPTNNTYRFPPEFGTGTIRRYTSITSASTVPYTEDPFRPVTRALLEIDRDPVMSVQTLQRKLSVNQVLDYNAVSGNYFTRQLTQHPIDPGATPIFTTYPPPMPNVPYPPTDDPSREYWARRDRQRMARDIYVLLYLLGGGSDSATYNTATTANATPSATTDGSTLYSDVQLREMAQFAVNLVDGMDRDDVITRFEYDKDLSDGWNLDDDPYATAESSSYPNTSPNYNPLFPNDGPSRGEVFGVERLDLSISEVLAIRTEAITPAGNHTATSYDDGTPHAFGYVELYNHSPFDVTFTDTESWQVVIRQNAVGMSPTWERRLSLKSGAGYIPSGKRYTIASIEADLGGTTNTTTGQSKSLFVVSPTGGVGDPATSSNWMAPYQVPVLQGTNYYGLDLLSVTTPTAAFRVENTTGTDQTSTMGAFMSAFSGVTPTEGNLTGPLQFVLRRRAHPTRARLAYADSNDNPWVDVDIMTMPKIASFVLTSTTDTAATIQTQLKKLGSYERPQPYAQDQAAPHSIAAIPANSLSSANSNAAAINNVWHPHFDRDYTSIIDLLALPVFGPNQLTQKMRGAMMDSPEGQLTDQLSTGFMGAKSAAAKFLVPEDPSNWTTVTNQLFDNRWHRVLEFLEVPTRTNQNLALGTDLSIPRIPGKMNPNTFRNVESLAAVLDDSNHMALKIDGTDYFGAPYRANPTYDPEVGDLFDAFEPTTRDWWDQFQKSRDNFDPYWKTNLTLSIPLPGTPGSRPFRSLADVCYNTPASGGKHASVQDTILRALPTDVSNMPDPMATTQTRRRFLEIGTTGEHYTGGTGMQIDPMIRNRLLAKFANNTTTRSNSFAIFVSVKYFAAVSDSANGGAIRIGGPLNGKQKPEHRGFFVVDRSKLEQGQLSGVATYDFRSFIEYRKTLETIQQ
jgi:hypothetical protein